MMAKFVVRTLFVIFGAAVLLRVADYGREFYRRETLPRDLKPVLSALTPEAVIRRCGSPDRHGWGDLVFQDIFYRRTGVELRFIRTGTGETGWVFTSMRLIGNSGPQNDLRWTLGALPCLNGGTGGTVAR